MKYTTVGNCPYCDCEIGGISCGWGMSPESWEIMKQNHNAGHPENTPPTPPVTKKEGNTDFVKQAGKLMLTVTLLILMREFVIAPKS